MHNTNFKFKRFHFFFLSVVIENNIDITIYFEMIKIFKTCYSNLWIENEYELIKKTIGKVKNLIHTFKMNSL